MILVDSSVWIGYFNGEKTPQIDWLDMSLGEEIILIGDIILTEVLKGFQRDSDYRKACSLLLDFPIVEMWGKEIALESAANYRILRKKGVTVRKTIDIVTGTFCIHHQISLLHDDRDFKPLEKHLKLKTVNVKRNGSL
jgi:predicted nucleic acid-binding protein